MAHQKPSGEFQLVGTVLDKRMMGGVAGSEGAVALTAFVTIALGSACAIQKLVLISKLAKNGFFTILLTLRRVGGHLGYVLLLQEVSCGAHPSLPWLVAMVCLVMFTFQCVANGDFFWLVHQPSLPDNVRLCHQNIIRLFHLY